MKYFRREEFGEPEEITWDQFVHGIQGEFMWNSERHYYEYMFVLFGSGQNLIGSSHMYWIERD